VVTMNSQLYYVAFDAFGQNAHYVIDSTLEGNLTWLTDKPYVIINNAEVDSACTLNIPAGCRVYVNQDSRLFVLGKLNIGDSNSTDSVVFQGDRLDRAYFGYVGYPGEWGGLYFTGTGIGNIHHTVFKNCGGSTTLDGSTFSPAAIQLSPGAQLNIDHSIIENSIGYGVLTYQAVMNMSNCLIQTTGAQALALTQGGTYNITNCTFANYGTVNVAHTDANTVAILNYYTPDGVTFTVGDLNAVMRNCIIYGSQDNEITCDQVTGAAANLFLDHCLMKEDSAFESFVIQTGCLINQDPVFKNTQIPDCHITGASPAKGAGVTVALTDDLDRNPRMAPFDIGCYIYQQ
jgi:hypothetical protein